MFDYIVQPGDLLFEIAGYFDVSVEAILAVNPGIDPYHLIVGQRIYIPVSDTLYQQYPWYIYYPVLFRSYPRHYWTDRRRWNIIPGGWPGPGGRPDFGGRFGPGGRPDFGGRFGLGGGPSFGGRFGLGGGPGMGRGFGPSAGRRR